jgi:hypothetical protein
VALRTEMRRQTSSPALFCVEPPGPKAVIRACLAPPLQVGLSLFEHCLVADQDERENFVVASANGLLALRNARRPVEPRVAPILRGDVSSACPPRDRECTALRIENLRKPPGGTFCW